MAVDSPISQLPQLPPDEITRSWLARNSRLVILGGTVVILGLIILLAPRLRSRTSGSTANTTVSISTTVTNSSGLSNRSVPSFRRYTITPVADQDHDGLSDADEERLGTNPTQADTDGDGLSDADEVNVYHSNPLRPDTDGDAVPDGLEVRLGTNPNGSGNLLDLNQAIHQAQTK